MVVSGRKERAKRGSSRRKSDKIRKCEIVFSVRPLFGSRIKTCHQQLYFVSGLCSTRVLFEVVRKICVTPLYRKNNKTNLRVGHTLVNEIFNTKMVYLVTIFELVEINYNS